MRHSKKILQDDFWHDHPCGIKGSFLNKVQHRYRMEPWLRAEMNTLPLPERSIKFLEIGCGQAVDAFLICSKLLSLIHISAPTRRYAISYAVFC